MANHKSAAKRAKQNEKKRLRNRAVKTRMRHSVREVLRAVETASPEEAQKLLADAVRTIGKAQSKGVVHKNSASRKISRLTRHVQKAAAAPAAS
jgi:small subunit ribosomal protein S20